MLSNKRSTGHTLVKAENGSTHQVPIEIKSMREKCSHSLASNALKIQSCTRLQYSVDFDFLLQVLPPNNSLHYRSSIQHILVYYILDAKF